MRKTMREVTQLLGPLDPAGRGEAVVSEADRQADLRRIIDTVAPGGSPATWWPRRRVLLAGAGAAAAVTAVTAGAAMRGSPTRAYALTPEPLSYERPTMSRSAAEVLTEIATRTARLPAEPRTGDHEHLLIVSWYLWTQVDGERVVSAVVPGRRESWRGSDDSGRTVSSHDAPVFRNASDRKAWEQDGSPGNDAKPTVENFPAGGFPAMWRDMPPTTVAELTAWLAHNHPVAGNPAEMIVAITDLARERVLSAGVRADILRILATLPGLVYDGMVTDRAGRRGLAFSLDSNHGGLPKRITLIVDPAIGRLLGHEEMLTTTAGKLNVRVPAVISYESYLVADYAALPR